MPVGVKDWEKKIHPGHTGEFREREIITTTGTTHKMIENKVVLVMVL